MGPVTNQLAAGAAKLKRLAKAWGPYLRSIENLLLTQQHFELHPTLSWLERLRHFEHKCFGLKRVLNRWKDEASLVAARAQLYPSSAIDSARMNS